MAIDKEIKRKVSEDWLNAFSGLSAFAQNKLYKVVGPFIVGIELVKLPHSEDYRPYFVLYPLWKSSLKTCLDSPVILSEIINKKGLQFSIPYLKHNSYFIEAVECLKEQIPVSLNSDVTLRSLYDLIDSCFNDVLNKSNSAQQAKLFELKFYTSLYVGSQIQNVLNKIDQSSKSWNMSMFETRYGKFDLWFKGLQENVSNREAFLAQIECNRKDKKVAKLQSAGLTV